MSTMVSQITGVSIVYSNVGSGADQIKNQSSTSLAFVRGIHRWRVNSPHKGPVTRNMFPFDDVIMLHTHMHACMSQCITRVRDFIQTIIFWQKGIIIRVKFFTIVFMIYIYIYFVADTVLI